MPIKCIEIQIYIILYVTVAQNLNTLGGGAGAPSGARRTRSYVRLIRHVQCLGGSPGAAPFPPLGHLRFPHHKIRRIYHNLSPFPKRKKRGKWSYCGENYERDKESEKIKKFFNTNKGKAEGVPLLKVAAEASQKLQRHSTENRYAGDRISLITLGGNQRFRP